MAKRRKPERPRTSQDEPTGPEGQSVVAVAVRSSEGKPGGRPSTQATPHRQGANATDSACTASAMTGALRVQAHGGALAPMWPKGVSGNPGGRVRHPKLSDYLAECSTLTVAQLKAKPARGEAAGRVAARAWWLASTQGDVRALETIADRTEGKAVQSIVTADVTKLYDVTCDPSEL